jgi:hemoglobin-like flavoprotein
MTDAQIHAVQTSFHQLEPVIETATYAFYDRLFEMDPSLRHMFRASREEQARKLAHVLTIVVKSLDKPPQILGAVKDLGSRHSGYGVEARHYATVGSALLWTLDQGLGDAFTPEVRAGWAAAYGMVAGIMQEAANQSNAGGDHARDSGQIRPDSQLPPAGHQSAHVVQTAEA